MAANEAARRLVEELRAAKEAAGLSLRQIGRHTHYSRASWERWLNGKRLVSADALAGFTELAGADGARLGRLLAQAEAERSATEVTQGPDTSAAAGRLSQLPPGIEDFTGRAAQIAALLQALVPQPDGQLGRPCIAVVCGGGGIGKTSLQYFRGGNLGGPLARA